MNAPAMPGRSMTWREWLEEYEPIELCYRGESTCPKPLIMSWLAIISDLHGTAIGDEWRADNGRWSMRGKAVERATDPTT